MKTVFLALVFSVVFACTAAIAQETSGVVGSKLPDATRFEVVQTPFDKGVVFRLDKYTGQIHRLTTCPKDDTIGSSMCWKEMTVERSAKESFSNRPRFQILFLTPQRATLLINLETGQSWQFGLDPQTDRWFPFIECTDRLSVQCQWRP